MNTNVAVILVPPFHLKPVQKYLSLISHFCKKVGLNSLFKKVCMLSLGCWSGKLVMGKIFKGKLIHCRMECEI